MKKETSGKKGKLGLIIAIAVVVVLAIVGAVLALTLGGSGSGNEGQEQPETVESKLYWNLDREEMLDPDTMLTKREPGTDGLYRLRFAVEGEQVELLCADKKLVNRIDLLGDVVGLGFDADGIIIEAYKATDVATLISENGYVQSPNGSKVTLNSSSALNGMETTVDISNAAIYNMVNPRPEVPGRDFVKGQKDELKLMDSVLIYGSDENTAHTVFILTRLYDSKVYWRSEAGQFNSTAKTTTREKAKDGFWYMEFFCEGDFIKLRTKSQACIDALDSKNANNAATGLVFNHDGDIVDVFNAGLAVKGKVVLGYDVTGIEGNVITTVRKMSGTEQGRTYTFTYNDEIPVYNVTSTANKFGETTDIRMGDRLTVLVDASGKIDQIFLINRLVDSPMYYNLNRAYSSVTRETTRTPDDEGWYTIKVAVKGQEKVLRCKDKKLVTQLDSHNYAVFGLKLRGDVIVKVYNPECVTGNYSFAAGNWVTSVNGSIIGTVKADGTAVNGIMTDNCEIYDVSGFSSHKGAKAKLREGDRIFSYTNPDNQMRYIYITSRKVEGSALYWNLESKYSSSTGKTTRTPNADGYYVYKMVKIGKSGITEVKVKATDEELAAKIDRTGVYAMSLVVKNGVVKAAYPAAAFNGGFVNNSGIFADYKVSDTVYHAKHYTTGASTDMDISYAKIYNISGVYKKEIGEKTTLKPGDCLIPIYGTNGKSEIILVTQREIDSPSYWLKDRQYNSTTKQTLRTPNADGYYVFEVTANGKTKTVRTNDKAMANLLESKQLNFALQLDGDIVKGVFSAAVCKDIWTSGYSYYDVTKISGNKITLEKLTPGTSVTGDKQTINIKGAKIYNVSDYAPDDEWGKPAKLGIGDRIQTYIDNDKKTTYVYIVWKNTHEAGAFSYCEHCGKEVFWNPYYGTIENIDKHYYLTSDYENFYSKGWGNTGAKKGYDWVLDLNGFTYKATGSYAFAVRGNSTLSVVDTSKNQTGRITGIGVQIKDAAGNKSAYQSSTPGIFQVLDNGTLNLYGGTYTRTVDREVTNLRRAGVAVVNSTGTLNIYDGAKLVDSTIDVPLDLSTTGTEVRRAPQGGALYNNGGVINIYGGEISNNGKIHEDFKEFETAAGNGGNIFQASGELNIYGGKITNGWSYGNGGNIYIYGGKLNIAGGEISGGTSVNADTDNLIVAANRNAEVNITGGKITGGTLISAGNTLKISGKPEITMGENIGLSLSNGMKAQVGTMEDGAKIVITSSGVFTTDFASEADAKAMLDKNYFVSNSEDIPVSVKGKALACGKQMCVNGHSDETECAAAGCTEAMLNWLPWKSEDSLPDSGNYYLTKPVNVSTYTTLTGDVALDLNGQNVTCTIPADKTSGYIYRVDAGKTLQITDLVKATDPSKNVGTMATVNTANFTSGCGMFYTGAGNASTANGNIIIHNGIFDGRGLTSATTAVSGSGLFQIAGDLTVNGGTFYGINAYAASKGAGTVIGALTTSNVTINGGTFNGNKASIGGVAFSSGALTVNGGTFNKGDADNDLIYVKSAKDLVIKDATVNGGVNIEAANTVTLSGSAKIGFETGTGAGVVIPSGKKINVSGLTNEAKVYVTTSETTNSFIEDLADAATAQAMVDNKIIYSSDPNYRVVPLDKGMTMVAQLAWREWNAAADPDYKTKLPTSGMWKLTEDVNVSANTELKADLSLDLCGNDVIYTIPNSMTGACCIYNVKSGSLYITDSSADPAQVGTMKAVFASGRTANFTSGCGMFANSAGTTITIDNGIFDGRGVESYTAATSGSGIFQINGTIIINGGTFYGMNANKNSAGAGTVIGALTTSTVEINGGTFYGNNAAKGGVIFARNNLTINGGTFNKGDSTSDDLIWINSTKDITIKNATVNGGVNLEAAKSTTLVGDVKIGTTTSGVTIPAGKKINVSGLTAQAKIYVNSTETVNSFVEDLADEATAKALVDNRIIMSGNSNYRVIAKEKGLTMKTQIQWQEWNATADANYKIKLPTAGNWKLTDNVDVSAYTTLTGDLNLNMNGHNVTCTIPTTATSGYVYNVPAGMTLYITDEVKDTDPSKSVGTMATVLAEGHTGNFKSGCGMLYSKNGSPNGKIIIDDGIFDGRGITSSTTATSGSGIFQIAGDLTINGGTFYGIKAASGYGSVIGALTTSNVVINGGTFYGNEAKHGGVIFSANNLTIAGGNFTAGKLNNGSGGIAYCTGNAVISGGTFTAAGTTNYGGFFRFDKNATITGVTLSGGKAATNGNNISFCAANGVLTIGQDAVIDGGIMFRTDKTGNKLVLVGNAKVNSSDAAKYSLNLANATVHIGDVANAAVATVGATFADYVATYDGSNNVTGVTPVTP